MSSTLIDPLFLKYITIIAKPIAASAAATVSVSMVNICPTISPEKLKKKSNLYLQQVILVQLTLILQLYFFC